MHLNRLIPLLVLLWACDVLASSPANISADLKSLLEKHPQIPGMVAVLVKQDVITADGAAGVRKFGEAAPITVDDSMLIRLANAE